MAFLQRWTVEEETETNPHWGHHKYKVGGWLIRLRRKKNMGRVNEEQGERIEGSR